MTLKEPDLERASVDEDLNRSTNMAQTLNISKDGQVEMFKPKPPRLSKT